VGGSSDCSSFLRIEQRRVGSAGARNDPKSKQYYGSTGKSSIWERIRTAVCKVGRLQ
jgi:hypothetical protein